MLNIRSSFLIILFIVFSSVKHVQCASESDIRSYFSKGKKAFISKNIKSIEEFLSDDFHYSFLIHSNGESKRHNLTKSSYLKTTEAFFQNVDEIFYYEIDIDSIDHLNNYIIKVLTILKSSYSIAGKIVDCKGDALFELENLGTNLKVVKEYGVLICQSNLKKTNNYHTTNRSTGHL